MRLTICLAALSLSAAFAADHPNLNGTWEGASNGETVSIKQQDDLVDITESGKATTEIQCHTTGQACKVKGGEVTLWYSGPMLVMMETSHGNSRVVKKRFKPSEDGKSLDLEIIRIEPAGATEKLTLTRRSGS